MTGDLTGDPGQEFGPTEHGARERERERDWLMDGEMERFVSAPGTATTAYKGKLGQNALYSMLSSWHTINWPQVDGTVKYDDRYGMRHGLGHILVGVSRGQEDQPASPVHLSN